MNTKLKKIKHIWWDLDDTLYPFNEKYHKVKTKGIIKEYARLKGIKFKQAEKEYNQDYKKYGSSSNTFRKVFNKESNYTQKIQNQTDRRKYVKYDPKLNEFFKKFRKEFPNIKQSIISNSVKKEINITLKILKLNKKWITYIISTMDHGLCKPDPKCYKKVITYSKLKPSQIIYVGDRENADIIPAKKQGMIAILVSPKKVKTKADFKVKKYYEVLKLFE